MNQDLKDIKKKLIDMDSLKYHKTYNDGVTWIECREQELNICYKNNVENDPLVNGFSSMYINKHGYRCSEFTIMFPGRGEEVSGYENRI